MKLLRYETSTSGTSGGQEKPGLLDEAGVLRDLSGIVDDIAGETLLPENIERLRNTDPASLPEVKGNPRLGPCVGQVGKFICIGLNYSDHAKETGMSIPPEPIIFAKATSAICGPNDDVIIPRNSVKTDWEVELGVVIGKPAKYVDEASALDHAAGYCVINDVSEREFQIERSGQWVKGKSCDTFGPTGPWLVTPSAKRAMSVTSKGTRSLDSSIMCCTTGIARSTAAWEPERTNSSPRITIRMPNKLFSS